MRVAVIGGGIVGLCCAFELDRAGIEVCLFDPEPGRGASHAAAGMLSPAAEYLPGETALLELNLAAAEAWPTFADRLGAEVVDHRSIGTLLVGSDHGDLAEIDRLAVDLDEHGVETRPLTRREAHRAEPGLGSQIGGGIRLPGDHLVDPRRVVTELIRRLSDRIDRRRARLWATGTHVLGVRLPDGDRRRTDLVVIATGATRDATIPGTQWVRPVLGEIVRARGRTTPTAVIRAVSRGDHVYLAPRSDGQIVVGATVEEHDRPATPTVGGIWRLLDAGRRVWPALDLATVTELTARARPGTPDNAPILGPGSIDGLLLAIGHHRNGVLQAPLTAQAITAWAQGRTPPAPSTRFTAARFAGRSLLVEEEGLMRLSLNGRARDCAAPPTITELLAAESLASPGIAVAVNDQVVPAGSWASRQLTDGDRVEIVSARQGG